MSPLHRTRLPLVGAFCLGVEVGIGPILSPVASNIRQILKLTISLVLLGLLSGCFAAEVALLAVTFAPVIPAPGGGYQSLKIHCTAEDSIGLRYANVGDDTQHEEAMQLISEHCVDGNIETYRNDTASISWVFAACLQADGNPPVSQTCKYVGPEPNPTGFGQEDITIPDG